MSATTTWRFRRTTGGLFAPDDVLERLSVPDDICRFFLTLSEYDFRSPSVVAADVETESTGHFIDVEILGHIFEQSISDLERIRNQLDGLVKPEGKAGHKTPRKQEGAFYTPPSSRGTSSNRRSAECCHRGQLGSI